MRPRARLFNILISSAGRRVELLQIFRRTLGELSLPGNVIATDASRLSSAFHCADRAVVVPPCTSPEFVPTLLDICEQHEIGLVIPTIDPELPIFAENRERFREVGTTVAVSAPAAIDIGHDKRATHEFLVEHELPTVAQASVDDVVREPDRWPFPLLVKPRRGSAAVGVQVVRDPMQLRVATQADEFVVQTIACGSEHTVDVLADVRGHCVNAVPRRRIEVRSGEVSKGVTVRSSELEGLARRVVEALPGAYGALTVQIFLDERTGEAKIIEINPRFAGGFPLTWEADGKHSRWMIEEILGLPSTACPDAWREGVVMLRYDAAVFVDAAEVGL